MKLLSTLALLSLCTAAACGDDDGDLPYDPGFDITIVYLEPPNERFRGLLQDARDTWEAAIVNDLPAIRVEQSGVGSDCRGVVSPSGTPVEDILLGVTLASIDGQGNVGARAGPCALRQDGSPAVSFLVFDVDDFASVSDGTVRDIMTHEMAHALGFGVLWKRNDLVVAPSLQQGAGTDTRFTGPRATDAWSQIAGVTESTVPVANDAVEGSADLHWRKSELGLELMTPSLKDGERGVLSAVTLRSMEDLGIYTVDISRAESLSQSNALTLDDPNALELRCGARASLVE